MAFQLFSSAFAEGGWIPELHSCDGADISPSLEWTGAPTETRSFALVVEDPDAPNGVWCHWLLYDLGARIQALPQGYKPGTLGVGGTNDFGKPGYGGPCPPRGHGAHRYFFRLSALKVDSLGLPPGAKRGDLVEAMKGQVLAEAQYMGRFERR
jgi:Raf kinase inhibitor-like YbhB/YbcL family protein